MITVDLEKGYSADGLADLIRGLYTFYDVAPAAVAAQAAVDAAPDADKAARAAEARDRKAVFDAGAEVYDACTQCHAKYAVELQQRNLRQ